ncbi:MAG TPA: O-antigen ligase family protein [Allosphingosinicella sp.]|nr:O-antigen ligase family protein [Allosphingosinicella sp.]
MAAAFLGTRGEQIRFFVLLGFLLVCLLGGGASRADVDSLYYLRPAAILGTLVLLLTPGPWELRRYRTPFILLGLFAGTMLIQLIPLPPGIWTSLPGFSRYAEASAAAGLDIPWRPISLSPDLTLNSLIALLPCLVVLLGFAGIREDQRRTVLTVLIGFVAVDALLSVAQFAGGPESPGYLYAITNTFAPVGFFSNRNHNATLLAMALPMLAVWTALPASSRQYQRTRNLIALALGLFIIPLLLATGSRAGIVAGLVGLVAALWLAPSFTANWDRKWRLAFRAASVAIPLLLVAVTIYSNRAVSLLRINDPNGGGAGELRVEALPVFGEMLKTFSPQGIGYGAFDPVFRGFEPDRLLATQYVNHAHNDLIELALTGGAVAVLLLLLFLGWWAKRSFQVLRGEGARSGDRLAKLGAVMILILFGSSLVDYPLRTPLLAALFTIACCWLTRPRDPERAAEETPAAIAPRPPGRTATIARAGIGVVLAGAVGMVALGVTHARNSATGYTWWSLDANANANRAARLLETNPRPSRATIATATAYAQAALQREPVNAVAARTLAFLAASQRDEARSIRLMHYAETLSRRDIPTQLWMIETSVRRNDIIGALTHYDRALRTSESARDLLFPILIQAAASEGVTPRLAQLVAARPGWWQPFLVRLAAEGESAAAIEAIVAALRLDPAVAAERSLLAAAIYRIVELGDYQRGLALYRRSGGAGNALVRNGDFEAENRFTPFDWVLSDSSGTGGIMQADLTGNGRALLMLAEPGSSGGTVARQLLILPPGAYRIDAVAGRVPGDESHRPRLTLACIRTNATLLDQRLPSGGPGGQAFGHNFTVGGACPAQWLIVSVPGPTDENGPWLDRVAVRPAG